MTGAHLRSAGELQRAARRHARQQAPRAPWLVPLLVLSGVSDGQAWVELLRDRAGLIGDPHFAHTCHVFPADGAPDPHALALRLQQLLSQDLPHSTGRAWRWPDRRGLVLVTARSQLTLVSQALPLLESEAVLAVYCRDKQAVHCMHPAQLQTLRSLPAHTHAQACAAIRLDIGQRLLREPPTPFGQALNERWTSP